MSDVEEVEDVEDMGLCLELLFLAQDALAIFEQFIFNETFVNNPLVFDIPPIVNETHLNSIHTLIKTYSDIVTTKGEGDKNLLQTLNDLTKDNEQFEIIAKGLRENSKNEELRGQLLPQAYLLAGRFQQMQFAAYEAAPIKYSGFGDFITDFPTLEPKPEWLGRTKEALLKCSDDTVQKIHASTKPRVMRSDLPKEKHIKFIMDYLTADTPEGKYVTWLRSVETEISHYKQHAVPQVTSILQRARLGCDLKLYSTRLTNHAQAQKSNDKYTKQTIQQFSEAELNHVLSGWNFATGGARVHARVLGFLEEPFYCDKEVYRFNESEFNPVRNPQRNDAGNYQGYVDRKEKMLTLLANAVARPKQESNAFKAKLQEIYKHLPPVHATPAQPPGSKKAPAKTYTTAPGVTRPLVPQPKIISTASTLTIPPDLRIEHTVIRLENQIGEGSYAKVWKAVWMQNIPVAVKQITFQAATPKAISSIESEITLAARVRHPNVVSIYGVCQLSASEFWLVLEYADQGCLYEILANHSEEISWNQKWKWAKEAASAVAYLHQRGIIHRDIKSPNFLVSKGSLKICDFGMSTTASVASNVISTVSGRPKVGTVRWIAPECTNNNSMDVKSDVYALGIVLWEIAAREIPFSDILNDMHVMVRVKYEDLRPEIGDEWPPVYSSIMQRCWIGNPAERPNADELVLSFHDASPDSF